MGVCPQAPKQAVIMAFAVLALNLLWNSNARGQASLYSFSGFSSGSEQATINTSDYWQSSTNLQGSRLTVTTVEMSPFLESIFTKLKSTSPPNRTVVDPQPDSTHPDFPYPGFAIMPYGAGIGVLVIDNYFQQNDVSLVAPTFTLEAGNPHLIPTINPNPLRSPYPPTSSGLFPLNDPTRPNPSSPIMILGNSGYAIEDIADQGDSYYDLMFVLQEDGFKVIDGFDSIYAERLSRLRVSQGELMGAQGVPEPTSLVLVLGAGWAFLSRRIKDQRRCLPAFLE